MNVSETLATENGLCFPVKVFQPSIEFHNGVYGRLYFPQCIAHLHDHEDCAKQYKRAMDGARATLSFMFDDMRLYAKEQ